jgi:hypothetical protein
VAPGNPHRSLEAGVEFDRCLPDSVGQFSIHRVGRDGPRCGVRWYPAGFLRCFRPRGAPA